MGQSDTKIIEVQLQENLVRTNFIFKNQTVNTECIKDFKQLALMGDTFGPFERGKKYRMKFFEALLFIKYKVLKMSSEEKCDNVDVQRYAISERDDQKLILRDNHLFLNKLKEFKLLLESEIQNNNKPKVDLDRYSSYFGNIIDSRLLKLLRLAKSDLSLTDEKHLTDSEMLLYKKLFTLIQQWRNFYLKGE